MQTITAPTYHVKRYRNSPDWPKVEELGSPNVFHFRDKWNNFFYECPPKIKNKFPNIQQAFYRGYVDFKAEGAKLVCFDTRRDRREAQQRRISEAKQLGGK